MRIVVVRLEEMDVVRRDYADIMLFRKLKNLVIDMRLPRIEFMELINILFRVDRLRLTLIRWSASNLPYGCSITSKE